MGYIISIGRPKMVSIKEAHEELKKEKEKIRKSIVADVKNAQKTFQHLISFLDTEDHDAIEMILRMETIPNNVYNIMKRFNRTKSEYFEVVAKGDLLVHMEDK